MADLAEHYLAAVRHVLERRKELAERAMAQLDEAQLHWSPDGESNSIAVIVKHLEGNMRSRWTDFLASDGEKPDRERDDEFVDDPADRAEVTTRWRRGWELLFAALDGLGPADLQRTVTIRGEPLTVLEAIERQSAHYAEHVGQIIYLAKHLKGADWQTLSIPRGGSTPYRPG